MPHGGARVGAGRPRKPIDLHIAAGTYRRHRHGPRPAIQAVPSPEPSGWAPSDEDMATLKTAGRALVARVLATYEPTVIDGLQLLTAAQAADVLDQLRTAPEPDLVQIRLWSAFYVQTLRALGLT